MEPNKNSNGMLNGLPKMPQENRKIGPIIGVLVIVLVIIIAALYFFGQKLNTNSQSDTTPTENTQIIDETGVDSNPSSLDNTATIELDLDAQLQDLDYSF